MLCGHLDNIDASNPRTWRVFPLACVDSRFFRQRLHSFGSTGLLGQVYSQAFHSLRCSGEWHRLPSFFLWPFTVSVWKRGRFCIVILCPAISPNSPIRNPCQNTNGVFTELEQILLEFLRKHKRPEEPEQSSGLLDVPACNDLVSFEK